MLAGKYGSHEINRNPSQCLTFTHFVRQSISTTIPGWKPIMECSLTYLVNWIVVEIGILDEERTFHDRVNIHLWPKKEDLCTTFHFSHSYKSVNIVIIKDLPELTLNFLMIDSV